MRLRIPVGNPELSTIVAAIFLSLFACAYCADARAESSIYPSRLIVAAGPHWTTTALFSAPDFKRQPAFKISNCSIPLGPAQATVDMPVGGHARVELGSDLCFSDFRVLSVPVGIGAVSRISFDDGVTAASFVVPALTPISTSGAGRLGPIVNDDRIGTWVNAISDKETVLTVTVIDESGKATDEYVNLSAGVNQVRVSKRVSVGSVDVRLGALGFTGGATVYGFLSVSDVLGGNAAVFPLK